MEAAAEPACAKFRRNCSNPRVEQDQFLQAQAEKRSRLTVLEQLEGSHEGFGAGALAALRQSRSVIGSLADRIRVPEQFVVAIENALGHHLQLVLTEQPESAQEILADLSANKAGRASVAALWPSKYNDENQLAFRRRHGARRRIRGRRKTVWQSGEIVHALERGPGRAVGGQTVKSLLGRTFIASDLPAATAQIAERPCRLRFRDACPAIC